MISSCRGCIYISRPADKMQIRGHFLQVWAQERRPFSQCIPVIPKCFLVSFTVPIPAPPPPQPFLKLLVIKEWPRELTSSNRNAC